MQEPSPGRTAVYQLDDALSLSRLSSASLSKDLEGPDYPFIFLCFLVRFCTSFHSHTFRFEP